MQQLDAITLKAQALELQGLLDNAKVSKVQHPSAHEFLITFWGGAVRPDHRNLFYIHLNPEAPFCVLTHPRQRRETVLHTFQKPTALCMLLRKHLNGATLQTIATLPGERTLNLTFENFNELGNRVRLILSLELMGKHTNMILYDAAQETVLAVAHGVSEIMSSHREMAAGLPYAPPPRQAGKRLLSELSLSDFTAIWREKPPEESLGRFLNGRISGLGMRMLEDVLVFRHTPETVYAALCELESGAAICPALSVDGKRFSLVCGALLPEGRREVDSVNAMVDAYFISRLREGRIERHQRQLLLRLDQRRKKLTGRSAELAPLPDSEIEALQATGDRLLAAYSAREVPPTPLGYHGVVKVHHYEDGEPWEIPIDPSLSWVENARVYYRRAKKAKARKEAYEQMVEALQMEDAYLSELQRMIEQAETLADLNAIESEMDEAGFFRKAGEPGRAEGRKASPETRGVLNLRSSDGLEILLGRSGQGNDAIAGKLSRPNDTWLHVHQMAGSHVLIRGEVDPIPERTLLEAATLAAYYSSARNAAKVSVIYTLSKYVRKIPRSYPGHVTYRNEKTLVVSPEALQVAALLAALDDIPASADDYPKAMP